MTHTCAPWRASHHARQRWEERFAGHDIEAAYARAVLMWTDDAGFHHLLDPETQAEFVARWHEFMRCWAITTVFPVHVRFSGKLTRAQARRRRHRN